MVEHNRNTDQSDLSTPLFDAHAHLQAQPVTPIPKSMMTIFMERTRQLFAGSSRTLMLIIVLGVATGALLGMAMVRDPHSPPAAEQASMLVDAELRDIQAAEIGVYGIQMSEVNRRSSTKRTRVQSNGRARAYRFAVIR